LDCQNNHVGCSSIISNAAKNFDILATSLNVLHNFLIVQTNLFSDLYLAKFLDTSAKPFILCAVEREINCIRVAVECGHKNFWNFSDETSFRRKFLNIIFVITFYCFLYVSFNSIIVYIEKLEENKRYWSYRFRLQRWSHFLRRRRRRKEERDLWMLVDEKKFWFGYRYHTTLFFWMEKSSSRYSIWDHFIVHFQYVIV